MFISHNQTEGTEFGHQAVPSICRLWPFIDAETKSIKLSCCKFLKNYINFMCLDHPPPPPGQLFKATSRKKEPRWHLFDSWPTSHVIKKTKLFCHIWKRLESSLSQSIINCSR